MGTIMRSLGYRAGYSGKWHLDGAGYMGSGMPGGGFEEQWWLDGKRYIDGVGAERHQSFVDAINGGVSFSRGVTPELARAGAQA